MVFRRDYGTLGKAERTPQGGLRVPAGLTRSGVFVYHQDGREIREWRPPEEVFHADSLATLADAPVTDFHPPVQVDPSNFSEYSRGNVQNGSVKQDADQVASMLVIQEAQLLGAVERRDRTEVSCGYNCDVEEKNGVTPGGERYDRIQRNIRYNHVAIVPNGRAGKSVALRLDSTGEQIEEPQSTEPRPMKSIRIDGIDFPLGSPAEQDAAIQAMSRYQAKLDADARSVAATAKSLEETRTRADSAEARVKALETDLATARDPKRMDALVAARQEVIVGAKSVLGSEFKTDGLTDREIKVAAILAAKPTTKIDTATSDDFINGLFAGCTREDAAEDPDGLVELNVASRGRKDSEDHIPVRELPENKLTAKQRFDKMSREASSQKLAFSKDN